MNGAVVAITLALVAVGELQGQPTREPAATEAEVAAIRRVFQEVETAVAARQLARRTETIACKPNELPFTVTRHVTAAGAVRRIDVHGGTSDHSETASWYYDAVRRVRFAFARRGAVNGTSQEERVYFSPTGAVVRRLTKIVNGPGYPFDELGALPNPDDVRKHYCA